MYDHQVERAPFNTEVGPLVVPNPLSSRGEAIVVSRSLRDDPLARLHARRQIEDADLKAGRDWQALWEAVEIGSVGGMDPTREYVDGGRQAIDLITDSRVKASKRLAELDRALGKEGASIVRDVLAHRRFLEEVAERRGMLGEREISYLGRRFRECLRSLSIEMGYREVAS